MFSNMNLKITLYFLYSLVCIFLVGIDSVVERSKTLAILSDALNGLTTIRALGKTEHMLQQFINCQVQLLRVHISIVLF